MNKHIVSYTLLTLFAVLLGVGTISYEVGKRAGIEDASCYALVAVGSAQTALPVDLAPCPPERRPGSADLGVPL